MKGKICPFSLSLSLSLSFSLMERMYKVQTRANMRGRADEKRNPFKGGKMITGQDIENTLSHPPHHTRKREVGLTLFSSFALFSLFSALLLLAHLFLCFDRQTHTHNTHKPHFELPMLRTLLGRSKDYYSFTSSG